MATVYTTHIAEDLQTEFMHPRFHIWRVIELFAEIGTGGGG